MVEIGALQAKLTQASKLSYPADLSTDMNVVDLRLPVPSPTPIFNREIASFKGHFT